MHPIQADFVSELITTEKDGCSTVFVDLLIRNLSDEPIEKLNMIYPNKFYEFTEGLDGTGELIQVGFFYDFTKTLLTNTDQVNKIYESCGEILTHPNSHVAFDMPGWGNYIGLIQPDPADSTKTQQYDGIVGQSVTITPREGLLDTCWAVLGQISYSLFECTLTPALTKKHPRWIRLGFAGECAHINRHHTQKHRLKKYLTDKLRYEYQIFGPYDVRDRFITYMKSFQGNCRGESDGYLRMREAICALNLLIENDQLKDSKVNLPMWLISVNPGELERLTDPNKEGEVKIAGMQPNPIPIDGQYYNMYQWKTGRPVTGRDDAEYKFSLLFQTKCSCWFFDWLPWISFGLAVAGIILSIIFFYFSLHEN